ncbi:MAG: DUF6173 family protein [Pelosinus sp.]|nr:DUF6173 family protein [Pelosinus sp.]
MEPTDFLRKMTETNMRMARVPSFKQQLMQINEPYTAKSIFRQLVQQIQHFEAALNEEYDVGIKLVSFGQSVQFSVVSLGYLDPNLIWFEGMLPDGTNVELLQHISQISFLMMAVKRAEPEKPKTPIGFQCPQ